MIFKTSNQTINKTKKKNRQLGKLIHKNLKIDIQCSAVSADT